MRKIPVAITAGDVSGIGPEVVLKSVLDRKVQARCQPILIGPLEVLRDTAEVLGIEVTLEEYASGRSLFPGDMVPVIDVGELKTRDFDFGEGTRLTGRSALESIIAGAQLAEAGVVSALVTAPVSKKAIAESGNPFTGHTEFLAALTGSKRFAMMFVSPKVKITLATTHLPLKKVAGNITSRTISEKLRLTTKALQLYWGIDRPHIAVCALNPHGGEKGLLGDEEKKTIAPVINRLRREGIAVEGPFPADTIFSEKNLKNFDAFLAMYHDQGLMPLKMGGVGGSVNVTLGLPFIRTSPDFGCAFEIAGKGVAEQTGMVEAINLAIEMSRRKGNREPGTGDRE
jgi:4-hydroxythreonine-4-phosphate dehydrogenase